jgi:hypothetical protein
VAHHTEGDEQSLLKQHSDIIENIIIGEVGIIGWFWKSSNAHFYWIAQFNIVGFVNLRLN